MTPPSARPEDVVSNRSLATPTRLKGGASLLVLVGLVVLARQAAAHVPPALDAVRNLGPWAAIGFIGLYALAAVLWVPGSILTLAAGAIFGLAKGTLFTLVGATLGASLAFLVSRYVARNSLEPRFV